MAATLNLPSAAAIRALISENSILEVQVTANARHADLRLSSDSDPPILIVRTTVVAEYGKANKAVIALVAKALGIPASNIELLRGATGRRKLLRVPT